MFKIENVKNVFQIKEGMYISSTEEFKQIIGYKIKSGTGYIKLDKEIEIEIDEDNIGEYNFAIIDDPNEHIGVQITYNCKLCSNPSVVFETLSQAEEHSKRCLFNPRAKSCVMCEHLKIIEYPPYPRFEKTYQSLETYHAFGAYKQPHCMKKNCDITEYELFDDHTDCFEFTESPPVIESTDEFDKYIEIINSGEISSKPISKEELEDIIKSQEIEE